ncbi:MAG: metal ABC transporter ATP-binding protein [Acidithiobacillus sp.]|uniref:metal ABC transporter ATP-binding protein n=1 Tax=Acidithiobacillus sp. TaxID=1872118 RepID=UPI003D06D9B1
MPSSLTPPSTEPLLRIENLGVRLGGRQVLEGLDLRLESGVLCGLIGENGAGKTTLLRSILGLQRITSGTIRLAGGSVGKARDLIGYVPQKIAFDPQLPLRTRDLVELGLSGRHFGLPWRRRRYQAATKAALAAVGAEHFADQRLGRLSGGQQQRAVIAHALVREPRLLLLDEPLANLDFRSTTSLVQLLGTLVREHGLTVLVTAHDMNPLLPVLDRLVYLVGGRAATGTVDEVVRPDVLSRLYGYPVTVLRHHGRFLVLPDAPDGPGEMRHAGTELPPPSPREEA